MFCVLCNLVIKAVHVVWTGVVATENIISPCVARRIHRESSIPSENSQNTQTLVSHITNGHIMDGHAIDGHAIDGHVMDGHVMDGQAMDGHAVNAQPQRITTTASSEMKGQVLLQTATARATNQDGSKSTRVKILF